jgi:hypothetical protein
MAPAQTARVSDQPDGTYRPSWKIRLTIRLEEFDTGVLKKRVPGKLTKNLNGMKDDGSTLEVVPDPENPGRFIFRDKNPRQPKLAWGLMGSFFPDTSSDDLTHVISGVIPKSFDWKANGIRAADELRATIRAEDLPIDPRCCRSIGVEFFLGTLTPLEYAMGARGRTRGDVFGSGVPNANEPLSIIPDTYVDDNGNRRSNLRFQGWADVSKLILSDNEEPWIELECRDHTQLLLGQGAPPRLVIGAKDPIDKAVATYLSNFRQFAGLSVEYAGADGDKAPSLEKVLAKTAFRPELGPQPAGAGGGDDDLTVWDYITDVCGAIGHVVFLDGVRVIIARPATILAGRVSTRSDDPYKGRKLEAGEFPARAMVYGRNLSRLEIKRDFANREAKNIEVRCWSPKTKQLLVARYPTKEARIATSTPGDNASDNKWNVVRVQGIEDKALLQQMAEDYYNARARTELEVVMKTKALASFGGGNADPDLLDLKATDAVEVLVDRGGDSSTSKVEQQLSAQAANEKHLISLGYTQGFARAYANAYTAAGFQRLFRVREMNISGDVEEGVTVEIRAANFVQVRGEVDKSAKPAEGQPAKKKAAASPEGKAPPKGSTTVQPERERLPGEVQIGTRPNGSPIWGKPP